MKVLVFIFLVLHFSLAPRADSPSPETEQRIRQLEEKLRCLVCQNQSLADSNAELAGDLRLQVREQVKAGRSDQEITDYMVQRYGDFVLYEPPFKASTALLWIGPFVLLAGAIAALIAILRRRRAAPEQTTLAPHERSLVERALSADIGGDSGPGDGRRAP